MKRFKKTTIFSLLILAISIFLPLANLSGLSNSAKADTTSYSNISPNYQSNASGTRPNTANSWTIPGQTDVVNHQGGTAAGWDGVSSWNGDSSNTTSSYIKYGTNSGNPDFAIRKYAKQTTTPGLYDVYLNARGNTQQDIKPIDIVLVVDMSGSMTQTTNGVSKATAVQNGIAQFMSSIAAAGYANYVNVGLVGYSNVIRTTVPMASMTSNASNINNAISTNGPNGTTFTQLGIRNGAAMLNADTSGNKKMMILMTDGIPNQSYHVLTASTVNGLVNGNTFSSIQIDSADTATSKFNNSYAASGLTIADTWAATMGEAGIAKASPNNDEIHVLGIQLTGNNYLNIGQITTRMQALASSDTNGPMYQAAASPTEVQSYLVSQAQNVISSFNTIVNGSITDPLGSQFIYSGANPQVTSVGSVAVDTSLISAGIANGTINIANLNLGKNQEIQIHYQVRINTEDPNFVPDKWYQMNGKTTLTADGSKPTIQYDFAVPSAKASGVSINVNKIWHTLTNTSQIPDSITFTVQRATTTLAGTWQQAAGTLTKANNWTGSFAQLTSNGQNVYLPKFNNLGQDFTYQVTAENSVTGFVSNIANNAGMSMITNSELGVNVEKYSANDGHKLTGASFTLYRYSTNWASQDSSFSPITINGNQALINQITPGYYQIKEATVPDGYQLNTTAFNFRVDANGKFYEQNGQEITATVLPNTDAFYLKTTATGGKEIILAAYNGLKNFDLTVNKTDAANGKAVTGAEFTLKNANGNTIAVSVSNSGSTFNFSGLKAGTYSLSESKTPDGYIPIANAIQITINQDGTVSIPGNTHWQSVLTSGGTANTITLTVPNSVKGILPVTGGPGNMVYVTVSISLITIALISSGYYFYRIKRRQQDD
ncbi:VWA domain-containing protein [Oenococcus sicerae]|uniref:VWA domain-containing protein n=1 Tax=Oenococcus sicerae TaxID=2203724 RepID=A0AAJ1R8E9_9LACO|nr:SpaA isopeptide-forming pilin-related protein [Oenococcus sicerae]MDN6899672.1 VWA domain-containing protein [Oenococcus sicerae]QAS70367.1 VWA domain-containing protein [Oenococcus sicerae]